MRLRSAALILCLALPLASHAMSKKQELTVRFHSEANPRDGSTFSAPINLIYQHKKIYLNKAADISEKQIDAIYPFRARDGSWGCMFKLNAQGRLRLETLSSESPGSTIVAFVGTKTGTHQVVDMVIDRPITDGVIPIPRGLTQLEVAALQQQFKLIGAAQPADRTKRPKPDDMPDGRIDRKYPDRMTNPPANYFPGPHGSSNSGSAREPELPRLAD